MIYTYYSYMSQFLHSGVGGANIWLMMARVGASTKFLYVSEALGRGYMSIKYNIVKVPLRASACCRLGRVSCRETS